LIVAFIGHAVAVKDQLYLLPYDGDGQSPTMDNAYPLGQRIAELVRRYNGLDGLVPLLDACQSGVGVADLMLRASVEIAETGMRVQLLTATYNQAARDGCFTRTLHELLRDGLADQPQDLLVADTLAPQIARTCREQEQPRSATFQGRWRVNDPGLWLGRNGQATRLGPLGSGTPDAHLADDITRWFQPTKSIEELVSASLVNPLVLLEGKAGSGKSALSAAVADPRAAHIADWGIVPSGFVHALVFASLAPSPQAVATTLNEQLTRTVVGFRSASVAYQAGLTVEQATTANKLELKVLGPLRLLHDDMSQDAPCIRIIIDGWYELAERG
jgi:hypothetical protein